MPSTPRLSRPAVVLSLFLVMGLMGLTGCSGTKVVNTWAEPGYVASSPDKVLVLAKIEPAETRRVIENAFVAELTKQGVPAAAAYEVVEDEVIGDKDRFMAALKEQNVDALVLYQSVRTRTDYKDKPSVKASAGVPVEVGFMRVFVGGSVPLAGSGKKAVPRAEVEVSYYQDSADAARWRATYDLKLDDGTNKLAQWAAQETAKRLKSSNVLP